MGTNPMHHTPALPPKWPVKDCCGIETWYCPQCGTPEPEGDIHEDAWEQLGEIACQDCGDEVLFEAGFSPSSDDIETLIAGQKDNHL